MTQFPSIAPPEVNVTIEYTGANAETVTKAAIVPLERSINGVPGMKYMSSDAGNDGVGVVQILFEVGTNPDIAAVNVQNRVAAVMGELPPEVTRNGVKIAKEENAMLMFLNIYSSDTSMQEKFLYNFADINVLPELKRINGVGFAELFGAKKYAMRIWLKPDKMLAYQVSTDDVVDALENQNVEAAPGKIGESSDKSAQALQYIVRYSGRYTTTEEYGNIALKANADGEILRLRDIADVEFGTTYFDVEARLNGRPAASIMLKQLPGSNASEVISQVKEKMAEIKKSVFLKGMDFEFSYDVSRFLDASVKEVVKTLFEAFLLVSIVVFIFLQDFRSTLIPALAVPVSLIGTFFFMQMFGFSLNLITLFALVLAIGIVVDNAIVVVEAVHTKMHELNLPPLEATEEAMKEITGAIIAITLMMSAVFVPVAFMTGPSGIFYRQFSVTMAVSIILSGISALTLTPALCALLLRNKATDSDRHVLLGKFFSGFNTWYAGLSSKYRMLAATLINRRTLTGLLLIIICVWTAIISSRLPSGFIPNEDQGTFYASITTPSGSTLERTKAVVDEIRRACDGIPSIQTVSTLAGTNILSDGTGATYGTCLINLTDWSERDETVEEVMGLVEEATKEIKDARIEFFPPPAVPGYGNASGFELRLLNKTGRGDFGEMEIVTKQFISDLLARQEIASAFTIFDASFPQFLLHVDHDKAAQKGVSVGTIMGTLQTMLGSEYASNFIRFGQLYKVMVQALPEFRADPEDILKLHVMSEHGEMVSLSAFVSLERVYGVDQLTRYNMFPSAELNGEAAEGYSSGSAIEAIRQTADEKLPAGYAIDWAGISRDEVSAGNEALYIFIICLVFVYFILAGQYESFLLPLPVIISLPAGIFGAFFLLMMAGLENNIYAQTAMIMLIGLLGKNAILIVEFAAMRQKEGLSPMNAAMEGAVARLRPILMTSFAFIAGLIPLMFATGAGALGNRTIGTAAAGGMLFGTILGVLVIPALYVSFTAQKQMTSYRVSAGKSFLLIICLGVVLLFQRCAPSQPVAADPVHVPASFDGQDDAVSTARVNWKDFFTDPNLQALIDTALSRNFDSRIALQRIEVAGALLQFHKGERLPKVGATLSPAVRRYGLYTMDGAGNSTTDMLPGQVVPTNLPDYLAGLQTTWEADVWGKLRNRKRAAVARYLSSVEGKNLVTTWLVSEVATNYFHLVALDRELTIVRENILLQENALSVVTVQKEAGMANQLAVEQFHAQLLNTKALEKEIQQEMVETESAISFLSGRFPSSTLRSETVFDEPMTQMLSVGIPADLLKNRPDIRQAELELTAAKADVRAARAAFYPSLNISGSIGFQAFRTDLLFYSPESFMFAAVGNLTMPLINRNAIKAEFKTANAGQLEMLYNYQRSILNGYIEVHNELSNLDKLSGILALGAEEVDLLSQSIETSQELFLTGRATYLEVLLAQQKALDARIEFTEVQERQWLAAIQLYRALGGGW